MTLPALIQKQTEKATVAKLKQTYSILSQAFTLAINDNGTVDEWCEIGEDNYRQNMEDCSAKIIENIKPYLKKIKTCDNIYNIYKEGCFEYIYKNRFDNINRGLKYPKMSFILSNGTSVNVNAQNGDGYPGWWCNETTNPKSAHSAYQGTCGIIYVDINGRKKPNRSDEDLFAFKIYKNGIVPAGRPGDEVWTETFENQCLGKRFAGYGICAAWVIYNENMDYLHCDDIGWGGRKKCGK